jgi:hypothetical protein
MTIELLARLLSTSALAGTRASLTVLGLALAARLGLIAGGQTWMTSNVALAGLLALVVLEELAEQDEDLQALFDVFAYALRGGAGALAGETVQAGAAAAGIELPSGVALLTGAVLATATHHLRARLHEQLAGIGEGLLSPRTYLAWLELGGVLGLLTAIVFAPVLALGFVVLASVGGLAVMLLRRAAEDRLFRRDCPHCGGRARVEASRCPSCRGALEVQRWL